VFGVLTFLVLAGYVALKAGEQWWRTTATTLLIALAGSSVIVMLAALLSERGLSRNSALLGESKIIQVLAGAGGILLYVVVLTTIGILWGAILRKVGLRRFQFK
jgi:hypothetical protein